MRPVTVSIDVPQGREEVPQAERLTAPLVRWMLRRGNQRSLQRLSEQLAANGTAPDVD